MDWLIFDQARGLEDALIAKVSPLGGSRARLRTMPLTEEDCKTLKIIDTFYWQIVLSKTTIVKREAQRWSKRLFLPVEDVEIVIQTALYRALLHYNPEQAGFMTYARYWIRRCLEDEKISEHHLTYSRSIVSRKEASKELSPIIFLDNYNPSFKTLNHELISSTSIFDRSLDLQRAIERLESLTERDQIILYSWLDGENFQGIATTLKLSRERVRVLFNRAIVYVRQE